MALPIEDHALLSDRHGAALVGRDGGLTWLCLPRFDSPACCAALLGTPEHGGWWLAPVAPPGQASEAADGPAGVTATRAYRPGTWVLDTQVETAAGTATRTEALVFDPTTAASHVVRAVRGERGRVAFAGRLAPRFDYGAVVPLVETVDWPDGGQRFSFVAGPERLTLTVVGGLVETRVDGGSLHFAFTVEAGQDVGFALAHTPSHHVPAPADPHALLARASRDDGLADVQAGLDTLAPAHRETVARSLATLRALSHAETGGMVAAPTTSLPEALGGARNWDYRYGWLRDGSLALGPLLRAGSLAETRAWRAWLVRAVAASPADVQILYGVGGERRLAESELPWLPGYAGSTPVRVGNAAAGQLQLDVFGEVLDLFYQARRAGLPHDPAAWALEKALVARLETLWREPDEGIWEVRGGRQRFTASRAMAWVAFDRAVRSAAEFGLDAPVARWEKVRDEIHAEVCAQGFDADRGHFTQAYGSPELDASLLLLAPYGFLPASDPRVVGTVRAIERELLEDGFVKRYREAGNADGLGGGREGAFLPCSFWLADNYALAGRWDEAEALFSRLAGLANDLGLLAEEYDPVAKRMLGNFPQAFTHAALAATAFRLGGRPRAAEG